MTSGTVNDKYALPEELEDQRVRSLEQLAVLDTPEEERFARITRMARLVFGVPMSAINFMHRDRQSCKQFDGVGEIDINVPRQLAVCRATIAHAYERPSEPELILEDASLSEFAELPAIKAEDGIRFYAGHPLYGPGGHPVGTFCIYDTRPRSLDATQREAFRELAAWAQREVERADDLDRAASVQRQLLPLPLGELPGYSVCALCVPAFAVGGDFYDHYPVKGGVIFTVADVMGKGLGAAILTASVRSALRAASRAVDEVGGDADLSAAVNSVNDQLADDLARTETFVTAFHARLEMATGDVEFVDVGHGIAAVVRSAGNVERLTGSGLPMGVVPGETWTTNEVVLAPGDMLVVASDGSLDLLGKGATERDVLDFVAAHAKPDDLCAAVTALSAQRPPLDDVTVVAVGRNPP